MPKKRLSAKAVQALAAPGRHHVGDGLYLQIKASGSRSWAFRYMRSGRAREMGLGSYPAVTLATAREKAVASRNQLANGIDPFDARTESGIATRKGPSFDTAAARYIAAHKASWSNAKHAQQWVSSLRDYASPVFGDKPIAAISVADVLSVIEPIWTTKTETASRVRMRIEAILDWACVHGLRDLEKPNPARWKGHLEFALPKRAKVAPVDHYRALDWRAMPAFWASLAAQPGVAALTLQFTILTAARTGEALGASWWEIDSDGASWLIPAWRMKARREHRVPLSRQAMEVLERVGSDWGKDELVFPGQRHKHPLSSVAMARLLHRIEKEPVTVHGFRSTFRDWVAEATEFSGETAEAALAHIVGDKVGAAYRRGNLFDKRRELMQAWADYCCGASQTNRQKTADAACITLQSLWRKAQSRFALKYFCEVRMALKDRRKAREIEADLRAAAERANDPLYLEAAATIHSLAYAVRAVAKGERLSKVAVAIADCPRRNAYKREAYDAARAMGRRLDAMQARLDYRMALKAYERDIARLKRSQLPTAAETTPIFDALASNVSNA